MATYRIRPCARLSGEITVHSAKNAVLPLMCGALLTRETVTIEQIPALTDVKTLTDILRDCGVLMHADQAEKLLTMTADSPRSPRREDLLSRMRASVLVMGPLLAIGLYQKSRAIEQGEPVSLSRMIFVKAASGGQVWYTGAILSLLIARYIVANLIV